MPDSHRVRDPDFEPYQVRRCPGGKRASPLEKIHWDQIEEATADLHAARADRGHTAIPQLHRLRLTAQLAYHAAHAARLADESRIKSGGDAIDRVCAVYERMPAAQAARLLAALNAAAKRRSTASTPAPPSPSTPAH